jgi:hypothetical protein
MPLFTHKNVVINNDSPTASELTELIIELEVSKNNKSINSKALNEWAEEQTSYTLMWIEFKNRKVMMEIMDPTGCPEEIVDDILQDLIETFS